jgi:LysM repeat protein
MGYGPRGGGDWPDDSGEHVRPVRRQGQQGRPSRRDATDPRGYERNPQDQYSVEDEYAHDEYGRLDYGRGYAAQDQGRGDVGWSLGGQSGGGHGGGGHGGGGHGGGRGGRRRDFAGFVPEWLPTWPTILAALTAVVFAFILGRVTGGGGDSDAAEKPTNVVIETTTTISLTPSTHIVARDETAAAIAGKYGISVDDLAIANNLGNVNHVFVGQNLKIPPPTIAAATTTTTRKKSSK